MSAFRRGVPYLVIFWVVVSVIQRSSVLNDPESALQQQGARVVGYSRRGGCVGGGLRIFHVG